jgi:hypothetical protein
MHYLYAGTGGYPPFNEENTKKLFKKITSGNWEFHPDYWGAVSREAKDFISKLLECTLPYIHTYIHTNTHQSRSCILYAVNIDRHTDRQKYMYTWSYLGYPI